MSLFKLATRIGIPSAKSAMSFLSKLKKPPKTEGITVYRGEFFKPPIPKKEMAKMYDESKRVRSLFPFSNPELRKQAMGRWFSRDPKTAMAYAGNKRFLSLLQHPKEVLAWGGGYQKGRIKKLVLSAKEAKLANKVMNKVHGTKYLDDFFVVPKHTLPRVETDAIRTAVANLKRMMGLKHGGLARILEV